MTDHDEPVRGTTDTYHVSTSETLCEGVVSAVADTSGADPASSGGTEQELEPLYAVIDPDALNSIFDGGETRAGRPGDRVQFTYSGHRVTVYRSGRIDVEPPGATGGGAPDRTAVTEDEEIEA